MEKKQYQQPRLTPQSVWTTMPVADMVIGSQTHSEQWAKERKDDDVETDKGLDDYGSLW